MWIYCGLFLLLLGMCSSEKHITLAGSVKQQPHIKIPKTLYSTLTNIFVFVFPSSVMISLTSKNLGKKEQVDSSTSILLFQKRTFEMQIPRDTQVHVFFLYIFSFFPLFFSIYFLPPFIIFSLCVFHFFILSFEQFMDLRIMHLMICSGNSNTQRLLSNRRKNTMSSKSKFYSQLLPNDFKKQSIGEVIS